MLLSLELSKFRGIYLKIYIRELRFFQSTRHSMLLNISMKFHKDIPNMLQYVGRKVGKRIFGHMPSEDSNQSAQSESSLGTRPMVRFLMLRLFFLSSIFSEYPYVKNISRDGIHSGRFSAISAEGHNFLSSCSLYCTTRPFRKGVYSIRKVFAPSGSKFFPYRLDPF